MKHNENYEVVYDKISRERYIYEASNIMKVLIISPPKRLQTSPEKDSLASPEYLEFKLEKKPFEISTSIDFYPLGTDIMEDF